MKQVIRGGKFNVTFDTCFQDVIEACATIERYDQDGTWLNQEMVSAYVDVHKLGLAHSVEVWNNSNQLVGGLYGISLGDCFFGESMFSKESNASKMALIALSQQLNDWNFQLIDCQIYSGHLESMGGEFISRNEFLKKINLGFKKKSKKGPWNELINE